MLGTAWERRVARGALLMALLAAPLTAAVVWVLAGPGWWVGLSAGLGAAATLWLRTGKIRRRRRILAQPFPVEWETVLQQDVVFFRSLEPEQQARFRKEIQVFLGEKRITGIKTDVDETTRVLVAASAVIPIFGFPDWEWDQINEVLIYPARFDREFQFGDQRGKNVLGMVGTGALNRIMILAKPDLVRGFRNPGDKRNVGVHEFAHLLDKSDGSIDGLPGLNRDAIGPWVDLVRRKMAEIERGDSDIDRYALTNEAEFFAVTSEYFFERPAIMERKHPELFRMLSQIFNQDLGTRASSWIRELKRPRKKFGRNSPCPCGSGEKFKRCCQK